MRLVVEKFLMVPMRDGTRLATDVYRPDGDGPFATVVQRLPYDKELVGLRNYSFDVMRAVQAGYAVVVQDTRGRFASEGEFTPFFDEAADGGDSVAWAAAQPWSTGRVAMVGGSYFGATQWLAATEAPPALRAIAPFVTTDQYYDGWAYQGGAFQLGFNLHWTLSSLAFGEVERRLGTGRAKPDDLMRLIASVDDNDALFRRTPLRGLAGLDGLAPYYDDWLDHPSYDDFWRTCAPRERWDRITVPALNMGGWYDLFLKGTLANYVGMKAAGGSEAARTRQRLVIGPWAHGPTAGAFPERGFGVMGGTDAVDITGMQLRWFDHLLTGADNGVETEPPVRLFVMGADVWRDEDDWPLPGTDYVDYHLGGEGAANTSSGDGTLGVDAPATQTYDAYLYDPRDPTPTVGGGSFLPGRSVGANAGPRGSGRSRRAATCSATPPRRWSGSWRSPARSRRSCTSPRPRRTPTSPRSWWTCGRTDGPTTSPTASCGRATGSRCRSRACWSRAGSTRCGSTSSRRRTGSRRATGYGSRCPAATSPASTVTPTAAGRSPRSRRRTSRSR
jgi:putative CocE/NonD family hydrolase